MPSVAVPLLLLGLAAAAPEAGDAAAADPLVVRSSTSGAELEVDLRREYIAGQKVLVQLELRNTGSSPVAVPDLSARPWLVSFRLVSPSGQRQERRTKPPASDTGKTVQIAPRGTRLTLLEIPSGAALAAGEYQLGLAVDLGGEVLEVAEQPVRIVPASPVRGQLDAGASETVRDVAQALWQHQGTEGVQVYLHEAPASAPDTTLANWYLTSLPAAAELHLAAARPSQAWDRHLVWAESERRYAFARLGAQELRGEISAVDAPWPASRILGRPATSASGDLHVPVWIPAPKGTRGELRILSIGSRGTPAFQRAALLSAPPVSVETTVSDDGTAHFLVVTASEADLYSVSAAPAEQGASLPVPARRVLNVAEGQQLLGAAFSVLPESEGYAGGLAVLALVSTPEGPTPTWLSTRGTVIRKLAPLPPLQGELLEVFPRAYEAPGLVVRGADGTARYLQGSTSAALGTLPESWALVPDDQGRPVLRTLGSPVAARRLTP